jgi:hypothetical protein
MNQTSSEMFTAILVGGPFDGFDKVINQAREEVDTVLCESPKFGDCLYRERDSISLFFEFSGYVSELWRNEL